MHCFENESLERVGDDYILGIDVLPDRAGDCLSHLGVARECAAVLSRKIILPKITFKEDSKIKTKDFISVDVKDKAGCKRYVARVLTNVKVGESPKYIQERLTACGMNPINNVVDATNYVMLEMGQPLHAFDYENIKGGKIIVRKAKNGEKMTTLSGLEYKLDENILVIADAEKPLALAGIKGGKNAEINRNTKTIVLESANFNPKLISQTARKINLRTDASIRFEQNLDPNLAEEAINRVAMIIADKNSAKIAGGIIDVYLEKTNPKKIKLDLKNLHKILGIEIKSTEIVSILKRLGIKASQITANSLVAEIPTFRQDIVIPESLIEEIGRVYGYEKIPPVLPCDFLKPVERNNDIFWQDKVKNIMEEISYTEVYNYSFVSEETLRFCGISPNAARKIKNPVSADFEYLRPDLIPQLLNNAKENLKTFRDFKIFELSKIFIPAKNKTNEARMFAGVILNSADTPQTIFSNLRGEINLILNRLGIDKINYEPGAEGHIWNKQNTVSCFVRGKKIGTLGQISSDILENYNIREKVFSFKIDFDKLQPLCTEEKYFENISFHPAATRDISGLVSEEVKIEKIIQTIKSIDIQLVKSAEAFDIYQGKNVPEKQKSASFHIIYQSDEKTLDTKTIDELQSKVLKKLIETFNWQERK